MTIQVIAIRMNHPATHPQHISQVKYVNRVDATVGTSTVAQVVEFLAPPQPGYADCVSNGGLRTEVEVVHASPPYIRSRADGSTTDNLLSLPRF